MPTELRHGVARPPALYTSRVARAGSKRLHGSRPVALGKFFFVDGSKFFAKGVTYGPFKPDESGCEYKAEASVSKDFAAMAAAGINLVRTYTAVPRWLLDAAERHGLRVLVGVAWPQHISFLDSAESRRAIVDTIRQTVRAASGHPAVFGYAIGNEIPSSIVRWYGAPRIERFLKKLYDVAKQEDPGALVTYVNYPTTEYLRLPFLDFLCYNVYLESERGLSAYVARLHNLAEDRPVLLGELGLDSERNGAEGQAATLRWQIETAFAMGCAGLCVFSWTDEWFRGGHDVDGWAFGLTTRNREPKPALEAVACAFRALPFPHDVVWPRITVVVCTYNGARYIRETCQALERLDYPDYEVIVVSDGSTDETLAILAGFDFRTIAVDNGGLSRARNLGLENATGEIVAYIDDDAYPDVHWLKYLAWSFRTTEHAGVGGPNIPPLDDPFVAVCVAHSPGGPNHVLLDDDLAEHIPGCNMAFRREALEAVGGFNPDFRIAGDDVDVCWKIQAKGGTLGFSPGAVVWHHRRNSVSAYLRQQFNYGRAEAMLAARWPKKFNTVGHVRWTGRLYGNGQIASTFAPKNVIYQGTWGTASFQALYERPAGALGTVMMMPEWHLTIGLLALTTLFGLIWKPLLLAGLLLIPALGAQAVQSLRAAKDATLPRNRANLAQRFLARALIAVLHYLQPVTRLRGRLVEGLRPWSFGGVPIAMRLFRNLSYWHESWVPAEARLMALESRLSELGARTVRGGDFDRWDLEVNAGAAGGVRILMGIEEHGAGRQLVRYRIDPQFSAATRSVLGLTGIIMLGLTLLDAYTGVFAASVFGAVVAGRALLEAQTSAVLIEKASEVSAHPPG